MAELAQNPDDFLKLDEQVCFPLYAASNLIIRAYRPLLKPLGLTYPQYLVMLVLWEENRVSVGKLGSRLHLDTGTLTPMLKRMEANGLVTRKRSEIDERRVDIELTEQGLALKKDAQKVPQLLFCHVGAEANWLGQLTGDVKKLVQLLQQSSQEND